MTFLDRPLLDDRIRAALRGLGAPVDAIDDAGFRAFLRALASAAPDDVRLVVASLVAP